jgi:hypothetical protein
MSLVRDTVAIPVARGINVNTPARLVDAQELLEAQNVRFTSAAGARKRRGHNGQRVRGASPLPSGWTLPEFTKSTYVAPYFTGDRNIHPNWYLGYGFQDSAVPDHTVALPKSEHPDSPAYGMASRDNESLVWDGNRLLSRTDLSLNGGYFSELPAVMPALHSEPFAKANVAQNTPDVADNGTIRVAVWVSNGRAYYSVFDSSTSALINGPTLLPSLGVVAVRATPIGTWIHMFVSSSDTDSVELHSVHSGTPTSLRSRSLGECNGYFDVWNHKDESLAVAISRNTEIMVRRLDVDGSLILAENFLVDTGSDTVSAVSVCQHPQSNTLALAWRATTEIGPFVRVKSCQFNQATGVATSAVQTLGTVTAANRAVAIVPKWLAALTDDVWNVYWDDYSTYSTLNISRWTATDGSVYSASAFHLQLGSQGFRVGDRTFIWASRNSTYQSAWVLLDEALKPVGRAEYVTAKTPSPSDTAYANFSVNWTGEAPEKDRCVYHFALSTRVRVPVEPTTIGENPPPVYSEPYIKFATIDFLPPLRSAQAGRTTYFAGAQLWSYDGADLTEAGFLFAPEGVTVAEADGGSLEAAGQYIWRVDLCYRNAQNEEIRSASFYTDQLVLTGSNKSATLTIPTFLTRRENAYFLIFRNQTAGTTWNLCNSRDPLSPLFLANDQSVQSVTYTDSTVTDTELITRELHPNQSFDYLDPFAAPAAEVIAAGRDRLWLAGGEIPAGQVYPSRLFDPGEVPAFHANLAIQVDRSAEAITAIGFIGEYTVFFRPTQAYILDNDGPDNIGQGDWNTPRDSEAKLGAISQESVVTVGGGILFQSPAGIRMFSPGGQVAPIGEPVDSLVETLNITAAVLISKDQEVRFYDYDGVTLVFNYQYNTWSTWTISAAGAIRDPQTNLAVVVTPTGTLLREAEDVWTDNGGVYKMRIRFAWLRAGSLLDYQQVRRVGAVGEGTDHKVHVDVYYNERDYAEEWFDWEMPDEGVQNEDTFGANNFGDGNFGDTNATAGIEMHDATWPWRRRLFRRKCSVISVAIDDNYTNGEGFTLTALVLELAKKPGLDRTPWHGGTYTNTGGSGSSETGN